MTANEPQPQRPRLLIADDDVVVRSVLRQQLSAVFTLVGDACDTDEAIDQAHQLRPDVIVVDVDMPGGGGLRATREIRSCAPASAIVVLSADESDGVVRAMIKAGATAYVRKGADAAQFEQIIADSIDAHALATV